MSCRYRQYDIGNNCIRCQLFKGNENYSFLSITEQRRPTYLPYVCRDVRAACYGREVSWKERILILGSGAVWLARVFWAHEVAGSSPVFPTIGDTCILLSLSGVGSKKNW